MSTATVSTDTGAAVIAAALAYMGMRARAMPLGKESLETVATLARMRLELGQLHDALHLYHLLTLHAPLQAQYRYGLGRVRQLGGNHRDALRDYMFGIVIGGESPAFELRIAECQAALGQPDDAIETLEYALQRVDTPPFPDSEELRIQLHGMLELLKSGHE